MIPVLAPEVLDFPAVSSALAEPNGLLAIGGDLSPARLAAAYAQGIFPWFSDGDPILWWSPDPRAVIFVDRLHISRSLRKFARQRPYTYSINKSFAQVMRGCIEQRQHTDGTWITEEMFAAYCQLHQQGIAHSIEVWQGDTLVGGLYGILQGHMFCGESMFHRADNASKLALLALVRHLEVAGLRLIDCQIPNPHLSSLGAETIPRARFIDYLNDAKQAKISQHLLIPQSISGICD